MTTIPPHLPKINHLLLQHQCYLWFSIEWLSIWHTSLLYKPYTQWKTASCYEVLLSTINILISAVLDLKKIFFLRPVPRSLKFKSSQFISQYTILDYRLCLQSLPGGTIIVKQKIISHFILVFSYLFSKKCLIVSFK